MNNQYKYTVCIHCMTYNHKPYIWDALNGFAMQHTDFPYVALVMDDASTDGEPEVLRQYIAEQCAAASLTTKDEELYELIEINAKDNPNCHFAFYFLKQNLFRTDKKKPIIAEWDAQAKYIAECEGDDYWIDPYKLQKQVDYLEKHEECSICFNRVKRVSKDKTILKGTMPNKSWTGNRIITLETFCKEAYLKIHWIVHTSSYCYRKEVREEYIKLKEGLFVDFPYGDMPLVLTALLQGYGYCFDEIGSCYRVMSGGYNSDCTLHPEKRIADERLLYKALLSFDQYTKLKYHKYISHRILWGEFGNEGGTWNLLLTKKYWPLIFSKIPIQIFLAKIRFSMPFIYTLYKKIKK